MAVELEDSGHWLPLKLDVPKAATIVELIMKINAQRIVGSQLKPGIATLLQLHIWYDNFNFGHAYFYKLGLETLSQ